VSGCSLSGLCRAAGISRQGYHKQRREREREEVDEELIISLVRALRAKHPRLGGRKVLMQVHDRLRGAGIIIGRDRFFAVLRKWGLLVEPKRRAARTTDSRHALPLYRNLLFERKPTAPHQVWVSDITYIRTDGGFLYLSLVSDLYSREVVGWNLDRSLDAAASVKALRMAMAQLPANRWPVHHSDRGSQYCCREYVDVLRERGLSISMTEENHCYENSHAERINGILKLEYNLDLGFRNERQARAGVSEAIFLYNHERPHTALKMKVPAAVHRDAA